MITVQKCYDDEGEELLYVYDSPWRFQLPIIENLGDEAIPKILL